MTKKEKINSGDTRKFTTILLFMVILGQKFTKKDQNMGARQYLKITRSDRNSLSRSLNIQIL